MPSTTSAAPSFCPDLSRVDRLDALGVEGRLEAYERGELARADLWVGQHASPRSRRPSTASSHGSPARSPTGIERLESRRKGAGSINALVSGAMKLQGIHLGGRPICRAGVGGL
jgi:hypothetical protein